MDFHIYTHKLSEKSEFYIHFKKFRFVITEQIRCVTVREEDLFGKGLESVFPKSSGTFVIRILTGCFASTNIY